MLRDHCFENGTAESVLPLVHALSRAIDGCQGLAAELRAWARPDVEALSAAREPTGIFGRVRRGRRERELSLTLVDQRWIVEIDGARAASFRVEPRGGGVEKALRDAA